MNTKSWKLLFAIVAALALLLMVFVTMSRVSEGAVVSQVLDVQFPKPMVLAVTSEGQPGELQFFGDLLTETEQLYVNGFPASWMPENKGWLFQEELSGTVVVTTASGLWQEVSVSFWDGSDAKLDNDTFDDGRLVVKANSESWGKVGIVNYQSFGDGLFYNIVGYDYNTSDNVWYPGTIWCVESGCDDAPQWMHMTTLILAPSKLQSLILEGPVRVPVNVPAVYTATVQAEPWWGEPLVWNWTGWPDPVFSGLESVRTYSWDESGSYVVTVTARISGTTLTVSDWLTVEVVINFYLPFVSKP